MTLDRLDDPDHPAYGMGQAAELLGVTAAFLRSLDSAGLVSPARSEGGHRRYSRNHLARVVALRELTDHGHTLASAARILDLHADLAEERARHAATTEERDRAPPRAGHRARRTGHRAPATRLRPRGARARSRRRISVLNASKSSNYSCRYLADRGEALEPVRVATGGVFVMTADVLDEAQDLAETPRRGRGSVPAPEPLVVIEGGPAVDQAVVDAEFVAIVMAEQLWGEERPAPPATTSAARPHGPP